MAEPRRWPWRAGLVTLLLALGLSLTLLGQDAGRERAVRLLDAQAHELQERLLRLAREAHPPDPLAPYETLQVRGPGGELLEWQGTIPLPAFPPGTTGSVALVTDGVLTHLLVAQLHEERWSVAGALLAAEAVALLEGVPRETFLASLARRLALQPQDLSASLVTGDGDHDSPRLSITLAPEARVPGRGRGHRLADVLGLAALGLGLLLVGRLGWPGAALRELALLGGVLLLGSAPLPGLGGAADPEYLALGWPWPPADACASMGAQLAGRLSPGATPLGLLIIGLYAVIQVARLRPSPRTNLAMASVVQLLGAGALLLLLLRACREAASSPELTPLGADTIFPGLPSFCLEAGCLCLATMAVTMLLGVAVPLLARLLGRGRVVPGRALLAWAALPGTILMVAMLLHTQQAELTLQVAGRAQSPDVLAAEFALYQEDILPTAMQDPRIQDAVAAGDLHRAAVLIWSTGYLGDFRVPARITLTREGRVPLIADFDLPPGWWSLPDRDVMVEGESTHPVVWHAKVWASLDARPLLTQGTLQLLEAAAPRGAPRLVQTAVADETGRLLPRGDLPAGLRLPPGLLESARQGQTAVATWRTEGQLLLCSAAPLPDGGYRVAAAQLPRRAELVVALTKAVLLALGACLLGLLLATAHRALTRPGWAREVLGRFDVRLTLAAALLALLPLVLLSIAAPRIAGGVTREALERRLRDAVATVRAGLGAQADDERTRQLARATGLDVTLYERGELVACNRPVLRELGLIPAHPPPGVTELEGRLLLATTHLGALEMQTAYATAESGRVLAVSMPFGVRDVARAARSAVVMLGMLLFAVMASVVVAAGVVARRITAPLHALTRAADRVAGGDLEVSVGEQRSYASVSGELADLMASFDHMVQQLRESREQLVAAEKEAAWREMARQIAHEIKNPLTPIRLAIQHLQRAHADGSDRLAPILEQVVATVLREIDSLAQIATDFSDFARFPRRQPAPLNLGVLARECVGLYGATRPAVTLTVAEGGVPPVLADPEELRRVLVNLIKNALEALEGQPEGQVQVTVGPAADGMVELLVEDDGCGIPAEARERLFEPNFSTKTSGTGLGLAIVWRAITASGGTIQVEDRLGGGTRMRIRLPATPRDPEPSVG